MVKVNKSYLGLFLFLLIINRNMVKPKNILSRSQTSGAMNDDETDEDEPPQKKQKVVTELVSIFCLRFYI